MFVELIYRQVIMYSSRFISISSPLCQTVYQIFPHVPTGETRLYIKK